MNEKYCRKCGRPLQEEWTSCPYCGVEKRVQSLQTQQVQQEINTNEKKSFEDYIWVLPIIGALISLLALLFPSATVELTFIISVEARIWMWGYVYTKIGLKKESGFGTELDFMTVCMISTLLVIISAIMLIISANQVREDNKTVYQVKKQWLILGIILIFASIFWGIMMDILASGFWDTFEIGFGLIGPLIGGVLAIIGSLISK